MEQALKTEALCKTYRLSDKTKKEAVKRLDLEIPQGILFGFLGPNGAGKTTTIKMILDFIRPTSGTITVMGKSSLDPSARKTVGYLPEQPYFPKFLTPFEIVSSQLALSGTSSKEIKSFTHKALEQAGISEYTKIPISKLSKGLTQRVGIAQAIAGDPKLLILDEPASGLDPVGRHHLRNLLVELKKQGKTIFLSSHILSEIEQICDQVAIMRQGELVAYGKPEELVTSRPVIQVETNQIDLQQKAKLEAKQIRIESVGEKTILEINTEKIQTLIDLMGELKLPVHRIQTQRETLEDVFLRLAR